MQILILYDDLRGVVKNNRNNKNKDRKICFKKRVFKYQKRKKGDIKKREQTIEIEKNKIRRLKIKNEVKKEYL